MSSTPGRITIDISTETADPLDEFIARSTKAMASATAPTPTASSRRPRPLAMLAEDAVTWGAPNWQSVTIPYFVEIA